jgi:cobalt-zinc-cadmium efflux system outer membrane protein
MQAIAMVRRRRRSRARALASLLVTLALVARAARVRAADLAPVPDPEVPTHLTLADAIAIFHRHGFDLLLAEAAEQSARGEFLAAQAWPNPVLSAGGGHAFTYDPHQCDQAGCSATQISAGLSDQGLLFDLLIGKRRLGIEVSQAALRAAQQSRADADRTLTALLEQQYVQTVAARAALTLARELAASTRRTSEIVAARRRAGEVSEADAARADTSALEAEQAVDAAEQGVENSRAQLAFLLGVRHGQASFEVEEHLPAFQPSATLVGEDVESLVALARAHRPDLAAAEAQVKSAEAALALARRQRVPDVTVTANYQQQGHGQDAIQPPTLSFGVSLPVPVLYRNGGEILKAESALHAQEIQRDKLDAQLATDVRTAWATFASARSRVERMESRLLDRARKARDLVAYQYEKGAVSLFERLDAERTFATVNVEYLQNLTDAWTSRYQLEQAIGTELPS